MDIDLDEDGLSIRLRFELGPALQERLDHIHHHLHQIGQRMATEAEQLNALSAKVDDLVADVRAALEALANAPDTTLGADGQAAFDALGAKLDAFDAEVGDADGSDTPPVA